MSLKENGTNAHARGLAQQPNSLRKPMAKRWDFFVLFRSIRSFNFFLILLFRHSLKNQVQVFIYYRACRRLRLRARKRIFRLRSGLLWLLQSWLLWLSALILWLSFLVSTKARHKSLNSEAQKLSVRGVRLLILKKIAKSNNHVMAFDLRDKEISL